MFLARRISLYPSPARAAIVVLLASNLLAACASERGPMAPAFDETLGQRRTEYRCVSTDENGDPIVVPTNEDGGCESGFEMVPWT